MNGRVYDPLLGRFLSADPSDALNPGVGFNRYSYVLNNPLSYRDPTGFILETAWDALNVGIGVASAVANVYEGNYMDAAVDVVGVVADTVAMAVPVVPGGAGTAIRAYRAAEIVTEVVDAGLDAAKAGKKAAGLVDDVVEAAARRADEVHWDDGYRTPNGRYASPLGPGRSGEAGERAAWDAIAERPGWDVARGRVTVRNADGDIRVYDGIATGPDGTVYGLEIKSNTGRKNGHQCRFDCGVSPDNPATGVGKYNEIDVTEVKDIRVRDGEGGKPEPQDIDLLFP